MQAEEQFLTLCFPTPIWRIEFSGHEPVNDAIRKELAQLDWGKLDEENQAAFGSLHSFREDRFIPIDDLPSIRIVLEYFLSGCNHIAGERKWDLRESQLTLGNYWVHVTPPGELTQSHTHKPAVLSGVYYVDKPENLGVLVPVTENTDALTSKVIWVFADLRQDVPHRQTWRDIPVGIEHEVADGLAEGWCPPVGFPHDHPHAHYRTVILYDPKLEPCHVY